MEKPSSNLQVALSMFVGVVAFTVGILAVTLSQAPIPPPPLRLAPWLVLNIALGSTFLPLLWWRRRAGYIGAIGVGSFTIALVTLVAGGAFGPLAPGANPVGPLIYAIFAVALIASTVAAWREKT